MIEKIRDIVTSIGNAVSESAKTKESISALKRTLGITKRQQKNILREMETYKQTSDIFKQICEDNPGIAYELQIGNFHLSNIEKILTIAESQVTDEDTCVSETIDNDWLHKFLDISGETSEEEKQKLLANILIGKLHKPDSVSYRTLGILKDLTRAEINQFRNVLSYTFYEGKNLVLLKDFSDTYPSINDLLYLQEIGLVNYNSQLSVHNESCTHNGFISIDNKFVLKYESANTNLELYKMTLPALELSMYIKDVTFDLDIVNHIILNYKSNIKLTLYMAEKIENGFCINKVAGIRTVFQDFINTLNITERIVSDINKHITDIRYFVVNFIWCGNLC